MAFTNNAAPNRAGQVNATGDPVAMFLKVFSGEVLLQFQKVNVMQNLQMIRTISSGKSAQFPVLGKATASYHTPGESLIEGDNGYLTTIRHGERTISIDKLLVSPIFLAEIDEARNHYSIREPYAMEMGRALSDQFDKLSMQTVALAARVADDALFTGSPGGNSVTNANIGSTLADTIDAIYEAGEKLDGENVPDMDRHCVVDPATYNKLIQDGNVVSVAIHQDNNPGVPGSVRQRKVYEVGGFTLHKSNNVCNLGNQTGYSDNQEASSTSTNSYAGNFSTTKALAFHKSAIGTVKLLNLAMESEYQVERQGTLMVAKYALGHGILRPEAAVELKTA